MFHFRKKQYIRRIYEELNRNLNPNKVENPISEEDWWEDFIKKPIFLIDRGEFWFNDGDIFINDDKELHELFKDEEDIGFLWLPDGYHPNKIKFFIKACGIRYLSKSVEIKPLLEGVTHLKKDEELTQHIQTIMPYILRYLYWKENEEYEKLKKNGMLEKILKIEVHVTDNLIVAYSIKVNEWKTISRKAERRCIYHKDENCIYMTGKGNIYDLAVEFSRVFGEIKGLDDFIMNIMQNIHNAEDIMRVKNIESLPESEEEILMKISMIKEIKTLEQAEKEKQLPESELKEDYSAEDETETKEITQKPAETLTQRVSESTEKKSVPSYDDILDKTKEKEWTPEVSPDDAPIKMEEPDLKRVKRVKETKTKITIEGEKSSDKKSVTRLQAPHKDLARSTELLSKKAREEIGRWGEEYALYCILKEKLEGFGIKIEDDMTFEEILREYSSIILETEWGFKLQKDGKVIVEIIWLNKNGESREHYDIKIIENGEEIFIEVKSTKEHEKAWFEVSKNQWKLMKEKGDKYYIYRVYGAGTKNAKLEKIKNPAKLWKEGYIDAYPIRIEI